MSQKSIMVNQSDQILFYCVFVGERERKESCEDPLLSPLGSAILNED